jgi:hypothetical protein
VRGRAQRMGQAIVHHVKLLIEFGNAVSVTKRLNFGARALTTVKANYEAAFNSALARAIATARK